MTDSTLPATFVKKHDDSCIIIDGMDIVNKIAKDNLMKGCQKYGLFYLIKLILTI